MSGTTEDIIKRLSEPFPREAIKSRQGGGGTRFDYIAGPDIIRRLTRATGGHWDWVIKSFEFRPLPPTRSGAEQSLVVVMGELTIPGLGTRAGIGVQKVSESAGEDLVKGASTDALKKAATLFGVALELYGPDFEEDAPQPPRRAEAARPAPAATTQPAPAQGQPAALAPKDPRTRTMAEIAADRDRKIAEIMREESPPAPPQPQPAPQTALTDERFGRVIDALWTMFEDGQPYAGMVDALNAVRPAMTAAQKELARLELPKLRAAIAERAAPPAPAAPTFAGRAG